MDVTIRPVRQADAAAIAELLNHITKTGGQGVLDTPVSVDEEIDFIRNFPGHGLFNVAVDGDGGLLGVQAVLPRSPATADIGEISTFVAPGRHRQGIGTRLGRATVPAARERGYATLEASIRADNARAMSFYRSLGFRMIGLAPEPALVRGERVDMLVAAATIAGR